MSWRLYRPRPRDWNGIEYTIFLGHMLYDYSVWNTLIKLEVNSIRTPPIRDNLTL